MKIKSTFGTEKNIIIGAIHFPPLKGYPDFPGLEVARINALADLQAFEKGGATAVIIENNYDIPHATNVSPEVAECLHTLAKEVREATKLPVGISVLWNDFRTALSVAKEANLQFIRVPVFVDTVKTNYGIMEAAADKVKEYQKAIGAEEVGIFADIHVKHAELLSPFSIEESAERAIKAGADALIVTGKWTGDAPVIDDLKRVRETVGDFPIFCGSGVDAANASQLFAYANGAIVSTSLKEGGATGEVNVKAYEQRISEEKVKQLHDSV